MVLVLAAWPRGHGSEQARAVRALAQPPKPTCSDPAFPQRTRVVSPRPYRAHDSRVFCAVGQGERGRTGSSPSVSAESIRPMPAGSSYLQIEPNTTDGFTMSRTVRVRETAALGVANHVAARDEGWSHVCPLHACLLRLPLPLGAPRLVAGSLPSKPTGHRPDRTCSQASIARVYCTLGDILSLLSRSY